MIFYENCLKRGCFLQVLDCRDPQAFRSAELEVVDAGYAATAIFMTFCVQEYGGFSWKEPCFCVEQD